MTGTEDIVKTASSGFITWLGNLFTKKSAKEKVRLIAENKQNQETIAGLKANLEFILEDNEELQNELSEKVKSLDLLLKQNGVTNTITGKNIVANVHKINVKKGGFRIGDNINSDEG